MPYLSSFIEEHDLGEGFVAEPGFILARNPDTVRAPDFAFVCRARIPAGGIPAGFFPAAPDLAVEVVSPSDSWVKVEAKVSEFLSAGAREVWVVNPGPRVIHVCTPHRRVTFHQDEILTSELLPGLRVVVSEIFG